VGVPVPTDAYQGLHLLPSVLSADFARLGDDIARVMDAGVRIIHCDVMDGHFVPNITFGPAVIAAIAPAVHKRGGLLSVHLMIEHPEKFMEDFARAGSDVLSVHAEACPQLYHAVEAIKGLGMGAGVAINPGTHVSAVREVASLVDVVLVMTVNPGFGGQKLIPAALAKVPMIRKMIRPDSRPRAGWGSGSRQHPPSGGDGSQLDRGRLGRLRRGRSGCRSPGAAEPHDWGRRTLTEDSSHGSAGRGVLDSSLHLRVRTDNWSSGSGEIPYRRL
jgi:ribulose-phosphate 3-epimerase